MFTLTKRFPMEYRYNAFSCIHFFKVLGMTIPLKTIWFKNVII